MSAPAPTAPTNRCGGVDGVYGVVASNYRIEVKFSGDKLMVVEPNRTSPYQHMGDCQYLFVHPNGTRYMLGVISRGLVAYKEGQDDSQKTPLALIQVSAAPQTVRRCTAERIPVHRCRPPLRPGCRANQSSAGTSKPIAMARWSKRITPRPRAITSSTSWAASMTACSGIAKTLT